MHIFKQACGRRLYEKRGETFVSSLLSKSGKSTFKRYKMPKLPDDVMGAASNMSDNGFVEAVDKILSIAKAAGSRRYFEETQ